MLLWFEFKQEETSFYIWTVSIF